MLLIHPISGMKELFVRMSIHRLMHYDGVLLNAKIDITNTAFPVVKIRQTALTYILLTMDTIISSCFVFSEASFIPPLCQDPLTKLSNSGIMFSSFFLICWFPFLAASLFTEFRGFPQNLTILFFLEY